MNIEEAKELLKEMKDNCIKGMMKGAIYTDEKAEKKALAIETVLLELDRLKKYEDLEWQEFNELAVASLELEKKDRIIKEMAGHIILMNDSRGLTNEEKIKYFTDMVEREGK